MLGMKSAACKKTPVDESRGIGKGDIITWSTWPKDVKTRLKRAKWSLAEDTLEKDIGDSIGKINDFKEMLKTITQREGAELYHKIMEDQDAYNIAYNYAGWVGPRLGMTADEFRLSLDRLNTQNQFGGDVPHKTALVTRRGRGLFIETHKPVSDAQADAAMMRGYRNLEKVLPSARAAAARAREEGIQRLAKSPEYVRSLLAADREREALAWVSMVQDPADIVLPTSWWFG